MSNYNDNNLISIPASSVPAGTLAMKVGSNTFTAGTVVIRQQVIVSSGGTDTSDANATSNDLLAGKSAYAQGNKIVGNIQNASASVSENIVTIQSGYFSEEQTVTVGNAISSQTINPTTSSQIISSGSYLTGDTVINGDVNLLSENIKEGISIFGINGSYQASSISNGSVEFYKCNALSQSGSSYPDFIYVTNADAGFMNGQYNKQSDLINGKPYYQFNAEDIDAVCKIYYDNTENYWVLNYQYEEEGELMDYTPYHTNGTAFTTSWISEDESASPLFFYSSYLVEGAGSPECNGIYEFEDFAYFDDYGDIPNYRKQNTNHYLWYSGDDMSWVLSTGNGNAEEGDGAEIIFYEKNGIENVISNSYNVEDGDSPAPSVSLNAASNAEGSNWTGYKAIASNGFYTFAQSLTSNLSYSSITPVSGSVYAVESNVIIAEVPLANITSNGSILTISKGIVTEQKNISAGGGIDISDTTATSDTVLASYDFYTSDGIKTTGTIQSKSAQTFTPTTSNQIISAGVYLNENQTILGDANLIETNIVDGVTIFGVTGTYQGNGSGSGSVSQTYYKCNSTSLLSYIIEGSSDPDMNGTYTETGSYTNGGFCPMYSHTANNKTYYIEYNTDWESWILKRDSTCLYSIPFLQINEEWHWKDCETDEQNYDINIIKTNGYISLILQVSNADMSDANGTYKCNGQYWDYGKPIFYNSSNSDFSIQNSGDFWYIPYDGNEKYYTYSSELFNQQWYTYDWDQEIDITDGCPTVTQGRLQVSWSGYQLNITSSGITYSNQITSGLTGNVEINGIYNADATKRIYENTIIPENIKSGVEILGVTGTYQGTTEGVVGNFYKCVSVIQPTEAQNYVTVSGFQSQYAEYFNGTYEFYQIDNNNNSMYRKNDYCLYYNPYQQRWEIGWDDGEIINMQLYSKQNDNTVWYGWQEEELTGISITFVNTNGNNVKEWTGQKAIFNNGVYTFQNNITSGLTYTVVTPNVNKIYANGALIQANLYTGIPDPNLYFTLTDATESVTEAVLTNNGVTFGTDYAIFDGSSYLEIPSSIYNLFSSLNSIFFCCWFNLDSNAPSEQWFWAVGHGETDFGVYINSDYSHINMNTRASNGQWGPDNDIHALVHDGAWHFCAFYSKSGGAQFACIDTTYQTNTNQDAFYTGTMYNGTIGVRDTNINGDRFLGNMAQFRFLFGKTLDFATFQNYCAAYKAEFTPPSA